MTDTGFPERFEWYFHRVLIPWLRLQDGAADKKASQNQLARRLGVSAGTLSGWRNGSTAPDRFTVERVVTRARRPLSDAEWLMTGGGETPNEPDPALPDEQPTLGSSVILQYEGLVEQLRVLYRRYYVYLQRYDPGIEKLARGAA